MKATLVLLAASPAALGWALPRLVDIGAALSGSRRARSVDVLASVHMPLQRLQGQVPGTRLTRALFQDRKLSRRDDDIIDADPASTKNNNLTFLYNSNYVGSLSIGGQDLQVIIDTGSSDTWLVKSGLYCIDINDQQVPTEECNFGPTVNASFTATLGGAGNFSIVYGDGSNVWGQVGFQDITVSGMTVKNQELVLIDQASYIGDGVTSGTMGFSYPITTRVFTSDNTSDKYAGSPAQMKYDPIFTTMYKQGLTSPVFSLTMDKNSSRGWLSFGGLPPVSHSADYAKTPIRIVEADGAAALASELSYYTIVPDGFVFGSRDTGNLTFANDYWNASQYDDVKANQFPVILDSGTTLSILPRAVVREYARQVSRPVRRSQGNYWALCDAHLPPFGVVVGGRTFYLANEDLLQQAITQDFTDKNNRTQTFCALGLMDILPDGPYLLGDSFLNSVVSVFDVGNSEMRFYSKT